MNHRRNVLVALGVGVFAAPMTILAQQQGKVWRIGFLSFRSRPASFDADFYGGFVRGMRELGYVEGKNVMIEWRFADSNAELLSGRAGELVQLKVDVIVTAGTVATTVAKRATSTIPIVMGAGVDPVGSGLVASLARPGGNVTGLSNLAGDLRPKLLEMLLGVMPALTRVAVLVNPARPDNAGMKILQAAAQTNNVTILPAHARTPQDIANAFSMMTREKAAAVITTLNPFFVQQGRQIAELAANHRLPSIAPNREYAESGGLMSYGQNQTESYRRAATYVDKILKGTKPGDLPIEQPTKFDLVINLKTAKALGLTIPPSVLIRATEVIE
jgi:putative tryptophan/tyrosine transport system substrate-binding protein